MTKFFPLLFLVLSLPTFAEIPALSIEKIKTKLNKDYESLFTFYKDLHQFPELSNEEKNTAKKMADAWRALGIDVTENIGGFGVVGLIKNGKGPVGMLRTELDALPMEEETGLPYKSKVKGVMHSCGHDVHMTSLMGVSQFLVSHKDLWSGTIVLVAQPSEEKIDGARRMIEDGLFKRFPKPDYGIALHTHIDFPAGNVYYKAGPTYASSDSIDVTFKGKGGHGALPHLAIDPFVMTAELTLKLQTLVGREVDPVQPALISIGSIHGGTKHNIIPDTAKMELTLRTFNEDVRAQLKKRTTEVAEGIAKTNKAPAPEVKFPQGTGFTYNDPELMAKLVPAFQEGLGSDKVHEAPQIMPSEDFNEYGRAGKFPTVIYWIGPQDPKSKGPFYVNHNSKYAPDFKNSIHAGVLSMSMAVLKMNAAAKK